MDKVCIVCKINFVEVPGRKLAAMQPSLVDMVNASFKLIVNNGDIDHQNTCELCTSDIQGAYRFIKNYELNKNLAKHEFDDFIDSLAAENWENIGSNFVKEEKEENISDEDSYELNINLTEEELDEFIKENWRDIGSNFVKKEKEENISDKDSTKKNEPQRETNLNSTDDKAATVPTKSVQKGKTYICISCDKTWKNNSSFRSHMRRIHSEQTYKCAHCQKSYKTKRQLKVHERVHTGERPYNCSHYQKAFKTAGDQQKHLRVHTGERPYNCQYCGKAFKTISNKGKHERLHTGRRP